MQEKLEQLRFLEAGFWIHTIETSYRQCAVDSKQDLEKLEKKLLL
jgi:CMP-2-keto-3-deoxyoctulosonic acid synthetase